ncbi:SusF/SusE family outer membrane protein [Salinimicrobium sp. TH3]|uniref:SusF/SusE family outer membrane protein n=1 Tax=Salinimicrobium sp. TH3 TaxID=2997342 RepID=UPI002273354D|nr:SusF/SusE family outer membrane protein [Salinimicrobium sp. TH3]MCY2686863.1 SusF/SusE family outer membrane protein [Salinimicrobium sp. TH3]
MKKLSILLLAFVALIGFNACTSDDDVVFIAQPDPEGIAFVNSFSPEYILTSSTAENTVERFVWNEIDLDVPTNINYDVLVSTSEDMTDPALLGSTAGTNLAVKVKQLMNFATEEVGLDNDPETEAPNTGTMYVQVVATAGTGGEMVHASEVKALNVVIPETAGEEEEVFLNFFLVGDATAAGWNPDNNNTPLFRDAENENIFYFTGRFDGSGDKEGFKLIEILGQWQPQWGLDNGNLSNSIILGGDPSAFPVDADAYYSLTMNVDEMTYSFEPYDESGAATYDMIGLVGEGTTVGWPSDDNPTPDILLTKSTFDPHIWYAQDVELSEAGIKFRANQDWAVNWGGGENFPSGQATGDDIIVSKAGIYNVWFNDITGRYIFIEQIPAE